MRSPSGCLLPLASNFKLLCCVYMHTAEELSTAVHLLRRNWFSKCQNCETAGTEKRNRERTCELNWTCTWNHLKGRKVEQHWRPSNGFIGSTGRICVVHACMHEYQWKRLWKSAEPKDLRPHDDETWAAFGCWHSTLTNQPHHNSTALAWPAIVSHYVTSCLLSPLPLQFICNHRRSNPLVGTEKPKVNPRLESGLTYWLARWSAQLAQHDRRSARKWAHRMGR